MTRLEGHPIALRAARLADEAGEPTTLRVMEEMLGIMHELEDRFPGVPFGPLLSDKALPGHSVKSIRAKLRRNGASEADIALVCPDRDAMERRRDKAKRDPYGMPTGRGSDTAVVGPDWNRL